MKCEVELPGQPVLIIEPDPIRRDQLAPLLTQWGYAVECTHSADEALTHLESQEPVLVILNVDMPNGYRLFGGVRAAAPNIMIIASSAFENQIGVMEQFKHLADDFLAMPVAPVALEITLARVFRTMQLLSEVKNTCSQRRTSGTCENVAREVENERFLAVRQIVEKVSAFISDVTNGAQGDVPFYNDMPYFISVHSPDCRLVAANSVYHKFLGNRLYENSWDIYVGKRGTRTACPVGRTASSNNVQTTRALVRYKSGARVPVLVHTAPIYNNEGEVALILEVFAGTQEIEQLKHQIHTTQQRYKQLFNAIPSHAVVLDRHQYITAANRKFAEIFGDHVGARFFDIFRPAAFPAHREPISQTYRDGMPHQGEMMLTDADGRIFRMMTWTSPILTSGGKMMQVLLIFADITELRQLKDNLACLGLMVGTVSHDLKGFLTGLNSGLYQIDKGFYRNQPGRIEEGLDTANLMADRIRKMVLDVLFSCKERTLELQVVDALQFAGDVATSKETLIRGADIAFNCDFSHCTGQIRIDRDLMRTTLVNFLDNAMEACLEDPIDKAHRIDFNVRTGQDEIVFEIKDNGKGMTPSEVSKLFNMFYSSKGNKGTGLGMFIAHNVVKKHGGTIDVESEPEIGTAALLRLPR